MLPQLPIVIDPRPQCMCPTDDGHTPIGRGACAYRPWAIDMSAYMLGRKVVDIVGKVMDRWENDTRKSREIKTK